MSPSCEICEKPFTAPNGEDRAGQCFICGTECCGECIDPLTGICKKCETARITQLECTRQDTPKLTEEDLDPANWSIDMMESDCGSACTPNGCSGHETRIPEILNVGNYCIKFPVDDLEDSNDWDNMEAIGNKLTEVLNFWIEHHPKK